MFQVKSNNIDELMRAVFKRLLSGSRDNFKVESRKGKSTEIIGALLELTDPRARLSRSRGRSPVFSALGEFVWYLAASNSVDFIEHYITGYREFSDDSTTLNGAYGPRIFSQRRWEGLTESDQWQRMINTLTSRTGSRNGIIQLFTNRDVEISSKDIPCTCAMQFFNRRKKLHMHVHMRSNDAFWGLPHDVFSFTMIQEIAARELGLELGVYRHSVASLHLYDDTEHVQPRTSAQR
jgi:thymidylate synthase